MSAMNQAQDQKALTPLIFSIIGLLTSFIFFIGIPLSLVGLFLGRKERKASKKYAQLAISISTVAIVISVMSFPVMVQSFISGYKERTDITGPNLFVL